MHFIGLPFRALSFRDGRWFFGTVGLTERALSVVVGAVEHWAVEMTDGERHRRIPVYVTVTPGGFMVPGDNDSVAGEVVDALRKHCVGAGVDGTQFFDPTGEAVA